MREKGNITDQVAVIAVILILIATLGVAAFNTLGNSTMVSNYSEPIANVSAPQTVYLTNSELKNGSLSIRNATYNAVPVTDYTVNELTGVITIPGSTGLTNGTAYTLTYQKDKVPSVVKTIVLTVIAIIGAISFVIILIRFVR